MNPQNQATTPNDPQGQRPQEEEKKMGEHGQIGNLQDPAQDQDQTSDAQLNQGQGNQGQPRRDDSQIEVSQDEEDSGEDVFSEEASNDLPQRRKGMDGGQSDQTP